MKRRVFISYTDADRLEMSALDIADSAQAAGLDVTGRHAIEFTESADKSIAGRIQTMLDNTSVTVVIVGASVNRNEWVSREIEWSLDRGHGLVGIRLDPSTPVPDALYEAGAEVLDWSQPADVEYLQPAVEAAARAATLLERAARKGTGSGESCARRPEGRLPS